MLKWCFINTLFSTRIVTSGSCKIHFLLNVSACSWVWINCKVEAWSWNSINCHQHLRWKRSKTAKGIWPLFQHTNKENNNNMADVRYALFNDICRNIIIPMHYFWTKRRAFKEKIGHKILQFFCKKPMHKISHLLSLCRRLVYKKSLTFVNLSSLFERKFKVFQRFVAIAANRMQDTALSLSDWMIDELIQKVIETM